MIWAIALLVLPAAMAALAYHMVRPTFRSFRISAARFLPPLPKSSAPRNRLSLTAPFGSLRFYLRMAILALLVMVVMNILPELRLPAPGPSGLRLVVDVSPSMAIAAEDGSRLEAGTATALATIAEAKAATQSELACIDLVAAGPQPSLVFSGSVERATSALAALQTSPDGASAAVLTTALDIAPAMACQPSHAVIISDRPPGVVPETDFGGRVCWLQVGPPKANRALESATLMGGVLGGAQAELQVSVQTYGDDSKPDLTITGPSGSMRPALFADPARPGGWLARIPAEPGRYDLRLPDGGALAIDDRISLSVPPRDALALDWQLPGGSPPGLVIGNEPGARRITVKRHQPGAALPAGPFLALYQPSGPSGQQIGPFMHDHPLLQGLDFDVFEAVAAAPLGLTDDLVPVLRPEGGDSAWVAIRQAPRGVLVPAAAVSEEADRQAIATLLFFNALRWLAEEEGTNLSLRHLGPTGDEVVNPLAESDTARSLAPISSCQALATPVQVALASSASDERESSVPLALAIASALLLLERLLGLSWRREVSG